MRLLLELRARLRAASRPDVGKKSDATAEVWQSAATA